MRLAYLIAALVPLSGCSNDNWDIDIPDQPSVLDVDAAAKDAARFLGAGTQTLAVCGSSIGASLFLDKLEQGFEKDGITGGIIVFATRPDGRPEVLSRDVTKQMIVASEDKANVTRMGRRTEEWEGVWVVEYPETGEVITYSLSKNADGRLFNLWTQNKPSSGPLPPRTSSFLSRCEARV